MAWEAVEVAVVVAWEVVVLVAPVLWEALELAVLVPDSLDVVDVVWEVTEVGGLLTTTQPPNPASVTNAAKQRFFVAPPWHIIPSGSDAVICSVSTVVGS